MQEIRVALGEVGGHVTDHVISLSLSLQLPIVDSELKKASGEETEQDEERGRHYLTQLSISSSSSSLYLSL